MTGFTLVKSPMITAWVRCSNCESYVCLVCSKNDELIHVDDCDCPPIDIWADWGLYPYGPMEKGEIAIMKHYIALQLFGSDTAA